MTADHDVVVIGSGFGGSVTALRLTEKGYRVAVLESGRRFDPDTLPKTSWDLRNFFWLPKLGLRGIQRISVLKDVAVLSGCAVGGGSIVYANTLYRPLDDFYTDPSWADITDWRTELAPFYDRAERMLGVVETPIDTRADVIMRDLADELGVADTFHPTPVGVYFGRPGETVPDPFFGGEGPDRTGCIRCGSCMTGCRHGAKNTLDANYLHLAERRGATVHPEHEVVDVRPLAGGGYEVVTQRPGAWLRRRRRTLRAEHVVFSAAALGTQKLLHKLAGNGSLPALSGRLGHLSRTNSEAIVTAESDDPTRDFTDGIAITSSIHPDPQTHIEPVRYGKGSNAMGLLTTVMVDGGGAIPRPLRFLLQVLLHPVTFVKSLSVRSWSERSVILLVMQSLDNSIRVRRGRFGWLTSSAGHGEPNPTWIPVANRSARIVADKIGGRAQGSIFEAVANMPTTAHFIGGCAIGATADEGVVDPYLRVHGYEGLHVVDGSVVTANLGVNPALTITAMAERAVALWPNRGEADPRPAAGQPYRRVEPVAPNAPAVPAGAPAALRPNPGA
jgi:cholesterol oxidase